MTPRRVMVSPSRADCLASLISTGAVGAAARKSVAGRAAGFGGAETVGEFDGPQAPRAIAAMTSAKVGRVQHVRVMERSYLCGLEGLGNGEPQSPPRGRECADQAEHQ